MNDGNGLIRDAKSLEPVAQLQDIHFPHDFGGRLVGVWGLGFGVWGLDLGVEVRDCRSGFRGQGPGCGFRAHPHPCALIPKHIPRRARAERHTRIRVTCTLKDNT